MMDFKHLLAGLALFVAHSAGAADSAELDFLGFAHDGRYLVFEQYGEGLGAPYSELYFVDVPANNWANKPLIAIAEETQDKPGLAQLRQNNREAARDLFAQFEITGSRLGTQVIAHSLHDLSADAHSARFTPALPLPGEKPAASYTLTLDQRATATECGTAGTARIFTLTLKNEDSSAETELQHDRRLPASRGCVLSYRIQDVYVHDKSVAVFLNMFMPALDGQSMRYLVVTGELP